MVTVYAATSGQAAQEDTTLKSSVISSVKTTQITTQKILDIIGATPSISRAEIAIQIGLTPDGINMYYPDILRKQGTIKRVGPDKGGYWEIVNS